MRARTETDATATPPRSAGEDARALLEVVGGLLAEVGDGRGLGMLALDASLERDLGLGSLERVELVGRVESAFGVRLPQEALSTAETPRQLLELVRGRSGAPRAEGAADKNSSVSLKQIPNTTAGVKAARERPAAPAPERARTLLEVLEYRAVRDPDRVHILLVREDGVEEPITYGELRREAGAVAARLRELGLSPRASVAIMLPTSRAYFAAFMGALLAGGVPVPLYPPFRLDRIGEYIQRQSRILENAGAEVLLTFERAARVGDFARDRVASLKHVIPVERLGAGEPSAIGVAAGPDDTALIQYTSGSTGDPKGVELTHANVLSNIRATAAGVSLAQDDALVSWLPLYHDMGLIGGWLMSFYFANPTILMSPLAFLSRPEVWLETMARHRATRSVAPNFAFELCTRRVSDEALGRLDLSCVRTVLNGSEPINPGTLDRFIARFGPKGFKREALFPAYGLAENMVAVTFPPIDRGPRVDAIERAPFEREGRAVAAAPDAKDPLRFVGVGAPVLGTEVRIVDAEGRDLEDRREGRLHFRGLSAFKGYFRNPEATAKVKLADGWVDSGDLAYRAEGETFITGRVKDIIIKGGRNYYPHELEAAAGAVSGVRNGCVAAFGLRDEASGTETIVVVAETRVDEKDAREALARRVVQAIAGAVGIPPDRVVLVSPGAVPKTSSGKIKRSEAKRLFVAGEIDRKPASFWRQAAGLWLGGLPARAAAAARRAAEVAYGTYAASVIFPLVGMVTGLMQVTPSGRPLRHLGYAGSRAALALAGLAPRITGLEKIPASGAILAPNHSSYLDMIVLSATMPIDTRYLVKGECRDGLVFGQPLRRAGHVFVERYVAERSLEDLRDVAVRLDRGEKVVIFPEGTFLREIGLRPFKLGAFRLACERGVPVVPIAIRGTRRAFRDGMWIPRRVAIEVEILDPIAPDGCAMADVIRLRDRVAEALAARIDEPRLELVPPG